MLLLVHMYVHLLMLQQVDEETGFDPSELIQETQFLELILKGEQRTKLFIVPKVSELTAFGTKTRKEISVDACADRCYRYCIDQRNSKSRGIDWSIYRAIHANMTRHFCRPTQSFTLYKVSPRTLVSFMSIWEERV